MQMIMMIESTLTGTLHLLHSWWQQQQQQAQHHLVLIASISLILLVAAVALLLASFLRYRTYQRLTAAGLPTVYWRPKFLRFKANNTNDQTTKMPSSTITNVLPRMQALKGPYGMYGTVYGVNTAVVHVAHPKPALAILSATPSTTSATNSSNKFLDSTAIAKAPAYNHFTNFCGQGVFTADGADWKAKRAAVLHALCRSKTWQDDLEIQAQIAADELLQQLETATTTTTTDNKTKTVNVVPCIQRAMIGLIYRYLTQTDLPLEQQDDDDNNDDNKSSPTPTTTTTTDSSSLLSSYLESVVRIRLIILAQSRSLWFFVPRWIYRTCSSLFQQEEETMGPIRTFAKQACAQATHNSPLGKLQKQTLYQTPNNNNGVSDNLLYEAITLLFAGQDTSAATLSWTLHLLSLYPDVQTQLAQEVCQTAGQKQQQQKLTRKDVTQMPLLDAVIKESMRLYPVAPFVVRKLTAPLTVPGDDGDDKNNNKNTPTTTLPAGTLACLWIYGLHHHPDFWDQPEDFNPKRWMQQQDDTTTTTANATTTTTTTAPAVKGAYMPFAQGPRNCVGQPLAHIMLRILLARLIQEYEFVVGEEEKQRQDMQVGFTVLPQDGVELRVRKRR